MPYGYLIMLMCVCQNRHCFFVHLSYYNSNVTIDSAAIPPPSSLSTTVNLEPKSEDRGSKGMDGQCSLLHLLNLLNLL